MNIAIFSDTYMPQMNGVAVSVNILFKELKSRGHNAFLFVPRIEGHEDKEPGIFRIPSWNFPFYRGHRFIYGFGYVLSVVKQLKFELIHAQTPFGAGLISLYLAHKRNIPMIHTYHTSFSCYVHYVPFLPRPVAIKLARLTSRKYCNACQKVISPSRQIKAMLLDYGINVPIEVLPTGVEIELFQQAQKGIIRARHDIAPQAKILLFVGRLGKEKNIDFLIKAFKEIKVDITDVYFIIVGDGPSRTDLEELSSRMDLSNRVIFAGAYPRNDAAQYIKDADLFIFASQTETQGLVLVEAMAGGLPVVALEGPGVLDVIKDGKTGFLCKNSMIEFKKKVIKLLQDDELRTEMSTFAREHASQFSRQVFVDKTVELYEKIVYNFTKSNKTTKIGNA